MFRSESPYTKKGSIPVDGVAALWGNPAGGLNQEARAESTLDANRVASV